MRINATLTAVNAPAYGLRCLRSTRTGEPHHVSFIESAKPGMMFVVADCLNGNEISEVSAQDARDRYASFVKVYGGVKSAPKVVGLGTDYCGRYELTYSKV